MPDPKMDAEVVALHRLMPGEVLLNGKPSTTSEVAERILELRDRGARERHAYERIRDFLRDKEVKAGMLKSKQHQIDAAEGERANLRQLMDWSSRLRIDGREA